MSPVLSSGLGTTISSQSSDSPQKIREAASQFEGLLVGEMLKTMHEDGEEGWLGTGDDPTASSAMEMADEYLAQSISQHGGLGLAQMIDRQLESRDSSPATPLSSDRSGTPHTRR